jgi:hypothetical protein
MIPHFMALYLRFGTRVFEKAPRYKKPGLSVNQFLRDNELFYGILESVFNISIGIQVFHHPIYSNGWFDGIKMYIKVANELSPNQRTQVWIFQKALEEKYHPRTSGGVRGFVQRYQTAYGELEQLGVKHSQQDRTDNLLKNLLCESTTSLVELLRANYKDSEEPFRETCLHLLNYYFEQQYTHNLDLITHPTSRPRRVQGAIQDGVEEIRVPEEDRIVAYGQNRSDDLRIPDTWWRGATPEEQEVLRQMRIKIKARLQVHNEHPSATSKPPLAQSQSSPLPQQYRSGKLVRLTSVDEDDDSDIEDSAVAHLGEFEGQMRSVFGGMVKSTGLEHVRCNLDFCDRLALQSQSSMTAYATADSGADTNVLGKEWRIVSSDPIRKVNLVGFDAAYASKRGLSIVTADTIAKTVEGEEIILRSHQSVSNPSTSTTLLSEVQIRHAGHVVYSVHRDHLISVDGHKGTQSLYLRQLDEIGEVIFRIPFTQRAGLMTFEHRCPDILDYDRGLPIVSLTLDVQWDPHGHYDEHGMTVIAPLDRVLVAGCSGSTLEKEGYRGSTKLSRWHHAESYSLCLPQGEPEEIYFDAAPGTDRQFYGKAFHLDIPQHWRKHQEGPHIQFLRQYDVDQFLHTLSYEELLGFLPDGPQFDSYIFAVREANAFRLLCEDPIVFLDTDQAWFDSQSDVIGGDTTTTMNNDDTCPNRSLSDWELNTKANQNTTATVHWSSTKPQYTDHDLQRLRPWLAWIPIENVRKTLENTTQLAKAVTNYPMIRHLSARFKLLNRFRLREVVSTDTIFSSVRAVGGARCAQVFYGLTSHHMDVYGMDSKSQVAEVYKEFIRDQGVPSGLHRDNAPEQKSKIISQMNRDLEVKESFSEVGYPNQNPVESQAIKWIKRAGERLMNQTGAPEFVWIWAYQYLALVNNWTADRTLRWKCPHTKRFGVTPDISALLSFHFYEPVYYLDVEETTPYSKEKAGYWLGVAHNVGDALTYHILTDDTQMVIQRSVVRSRKDINGINKRVTFDPNLDPEVTMDTENQNLAPNPPMMISRDEVPTMRQHRRHRRNQNDRSNRPQRLAEEDHETTEAPPDPGEVQDAGLVEQHTSIDEEEISDEALDTGERSHVGTRKSNRRTKPPSRFANAVTIGLNIGRFFYNDQHWNALTPLKPLPPTMVPLEQDMTQSSFLSRPEINKLREMYYLDTLNEEWDPHTEIECILKHRHINYARRRPGKHSYNPSVSLITRSGVRLLVKLFDGTRAWIPMEAAQGGQPVPVIDYARKHKLWKHPSWKWTKEFGIEALDDLRQAFIAKFENTPKYKFGVQIPTSISHALRLDKLNGNNLWQEAIQKEMDQLKEYKTFRLPTDGEDLSTYQQIPYHMVFDCKFDGRRKGRLVAGGNHTIVTSEQVYSGVVGIETVRTILALSAMEPDLQVVAADVSNAFLYGKNVEKTIIKAGPEFGSLEGKFLIVEGGWYGHKTAAATFHTHLSATIRKMGFVPSEADLDLWLRQASDGSYEYIASYVDDLIVISKEPMKVIDKFKEVYSLKGVGTPEYYLGGNFHQVEDPILQERGIRTALSAETYIKNATERFERMFGGDIRESKFPMHEGAHPESDTSEYLTPEMATQYRAVIGSLNWVVTLGRFDIMYATNTLARFAMAPRLGHLEGAKRILGYLKKYDEYRILLNPNKIDLTAAVDKYKEYTGWREFYPEAEEEIPTGRPKPIPNKQVQITIMVDADHAHCEVTRRSVTGILVFVNSTPVRWFSKMQKTVETSTYGSELVAARIATDIAMEFRFNIRMMGFALDGPANMFGDNQSVILNTTIPSSQLKKKIHACAYHRIREMITCRAIRFLHCRSQLNVADVLTKPLNGVLHRRLIEPILCGDGVPTLFSG